MANVAVRPRSLFIDVIENDVSRAVTAPTAPLPNRTRPRSRHRGRWPSTIRAELLGRCMATVGRWRRYTVARQPSATRSPRSVQRLSAYYGWTFILRRGDWVKRRELLALSAAAAAGMPCTARAQRPTLPVIAILYGASPSEMSSRIAAFREGLAEAGCNEGRNVMVEMELVPRQLSLLRELLPMAKKLAVLVNPASPIAKRYAEASQDAATALGVQLQLREAGTASDIDAAFAHRRRPARVRQPGSHRLRPRVGRARTRPARGSGTPPALASCRGNDNIRPS